MQAYRHLAAGACLAIRQRARAGGQLPAPAAEAKTPAA
jgi:hypothetical protein